MRLLFLFLILLANECDAQCKTYRLTSNRDTLDCTDFNSKKQGKWVVRVEELCGEPGFEEEGIFKNNLKEGKWRRYNLMGDLIAVENYKWNNKDGNQLYFYENQLEHQESWRAVDPAKKYDTIEVADIDDPDKFEKKIIKIDAYSMKHGEWKYYRPGNPTPIKTETYLLDSLYNPVALINKTVTAAAKDTVQQKPVSAKPKQVNDFDKKNAKKKSIKVRDGSTGY